MGKKSGHKGHDHHRHHHTGHHPFNGMGGGPAMFGPPMDPRGHHFDPRGPEGFRGPPIDPRHDSRMGCSTMGRGFGHRMFGRHFRKHGFELSSTSSSSSSSDSSSDSDTKCKKKCEKRRRRHFKHWHHMRHMMSDPNWNKVQCTLCWRQIRPLSETDVLECGHIYHRLCLKELFAISQKGEASEVFCTQCRQQVDNDLVTELQNRFNGEPTTGPQTSGPQSVTQDMKNLKVK